MSKSRSPINAAPKMAGAIIGIFLVIVGIMSIAVGTYVLMKKYTASSTIYFKIHLYEDFPQNQIYPFYPWYVTITAHFLKSGHTRVTLEIKRSWGDFDRDIITSFPRGFMVNLYDGYKIEKWEARLKQTMRKLVPLRNEPGWLEQKVSEERSIQHPIRFNVESKLFDFVGPTYIFHLAELNNISPPIDMLNDCSIYIILQFISNEPLEGFEPLIGGDIRVYIHGGVGEYEFKGIGKEKTGIGTKTLPGLHLFESKREVQNIYSDFFWEPLIQGKFSVPEEMVGVKRFYEMALNENAIKGNFVYEVSAAYWISFLGAILGLPLCIGGGKMVRKYFTQMKGKSSAIEIPSRKPGLEDKEEITGLHIKTASPKRILILSSNPKTTPRLRLDEEVREIQEGLQRSKYRDKFDIQSRWAVRLRDLRRALLDVEPQIVHFAGHGRKDGLLVEDELGFAVLISQKALSDLFRLCANHVECVILGSCYSEPQAAAIGKHIDYVIGMKREINDKAVIEFAVGFYDALGAGKTVEEAFEFGRNAIRLYNLPDHLVPVLKKKS